MEANLNTILYYDTSELYQQSALWIKKLIFATFSIRERFSLFLSGGSTPEKLYLKLSDMISDWSKIDLFLGDERYVPENDDQSNRKMIRETLLSKIDIPETNLYFPQTNTNYEKDAENYNQTLQNYLNENSMFDLILLGLGKDAHTLSLFPETDAIQEKEKLFRQNYIKKVNQWRLTATFPLVNQCRNAMFLIEEKDKGEAMKWVLNARDIIPLFPAKGIAKNTKHVFWFVGT